MEIIASKNQTEINHPSMLVTEDDVGFFSKAQARSIDSINKQAKNRLLDSASKILSILTQIKLQKEYNDVIQLRLFLFDEILTFKMQAQKYEYNQDVISMCIYALAVSLDEAIEFTHWGIDLGWSQNRLDKMFGYDDESGEQFFILLDRIIRNPREYADIIELMYICLIIGYEGKYKDKPTDKYQLQLIIDKIYKIVRKIRGEFSFVLSPDNAFLDEDNAFCMIGKTTKKKDHLFIRWLVVPIVLAFVLIVTFIKVEQHVTNDSVQIMNSIQNNAQSIN